ARMNWLLALLIAVCLLGGWNWWTRERHESVPPGIVAPDEPLQSNLDPPTTFHAKEHRFYVRARYEITARVLRKEIYRIDDGAQLAPVDLGLGWGAMSDTPIVDHPQFSQMGRFLYWKPRDWRRFPLTPQDMATHAAQVHAIPADEAIDRRLRGLRPGQVVTLTGFLVDVR